MYLNYYVIVPRSPNQLRLMKSGLELKGKLLKFRKHIWGTQYPTTTATGNQSNLKVKTATVLFLYLREKRAKQKKKNRLESLAIRI